MRLTRCSDKNFLNDIAIRYLDRDYQYQHYFTLFHNTIVSHNDIMTGSLEMGRARNSLQWPSSTRAAEMGSHAGTGCHILISSTIYYLKLLTQMGRHLDSIVYFMP